jgi:hypothetical protein
VPAAAAVASWMESLKMPMREIRETYTKSEITVMSWRSQEMALNMRSKYHQPPNDGARGPQMPGNISPQLDYSGEYTGLEQNLGPEIVAKLAKEEDVDLRSMSGEEALRYMRCMGINMSPRA